MICMTHFQDMEFLMKKLNLGLEIVGQLEIGQKRPIVIKMDIKSIEKIIDELEFNSEKDYNVYLKSNIDLLKEELSYIKENIPVDYSKNI